MRREGYFTGAAMAPPVPLRLEIAQRRGVEARGSTSASDVLTKIVFYEVYKHLKRLRGEGSALDAVAAMQKTTVVPLNEELALVAADLSLETKLPMADAIILATARLYGAEVITSDADFDGIPG